MPTKVITRRPNRTCDICNKPYYVRLNTVTESHGRTCSKPCGGELRARLAGAEWRDCPICGNRYRAKRGEIAQGKALTCSRKCADESKHHKPGRWAPYSFTCLRCGVLVTENLTGNTRYCSAKCQYEAQRGSGNPNAGNRARLGKPQWRPTLAQRHHASLAKRGERNPNWEGGRTSRYRGSDWSWTRKQAKERDGHRCRLCQDTDDLTVHHIKRYRDGGRNALVNLVTLCRACHARVHHLMRRAPAQLPDWAALLGTSNPVT